MNVSFPTDTDGFLSQECPSCEQRFKVRFGEGSPEPISFCPYCGHKGQNCWYTKEQVTHMQGVAVEQILGPQLARLGQEIKRASTDLVKIDLKANLTKAGKPPMEEDEALDILRFSCCNETVKLSRSDKHFCIICGKETDMAVTDAKKVFLSHKGIDKSEVDEYKRTLEILGYAPWFDEDAMPAGTHLERGLLQGMCDSCGVVFFITPSFKDEGYLQSEIDYAIQQKREKGDKFAIVTLQFIGSDGQIGQIPPLLKTYVWKKPKSPLEALREIVRALPVAPLAIDWREGTEGVVAFPRASSTSADLSDEAKVILTAAAASGDGTIIWARHMQGQDIQVGCKQLNPEGDPRATARWVGGMEDLQRRRYIKDKGHKGEVFEVTREGYHMADILAGK